MSILRELALPGSWSGHLAPTCNSRPWEDETPTARVASHSVLPQTPAGASAPLAFAGLRGAQKRARPWRAAVMCSGSLRVHPAGAGRGGWGRDAERHEPTVALVWDDARAA